MTSTRCNDVIQLELGGQNPHHLLLLVAFRMEILDSSQLGNPVQNSAQICKISNISADAVLLFFLGNITSREMLHVSLKLEEVAPYFMLFVGSRHAL